MTLFAEFHIIQNFAPSNLNRDDTGAPKDAMFGGYRRARISSQCYKRAVRLLAAESPALRTQDCGLRTKRLKLLLAERLSAMGHEVADQEISTALAAAELTLDDKGETQYLLFLGRSEIDALAQLIHEHWGSFAKEAPPGEKAKRSKKEARAAAPDELVKAVRHVFDGGKAIDVALFGRMLADMPKANRHAACQVAHSISTHRVDREFDYFTAVDDLDDADQTGAGMIGTVEFNSATFYRYALLDVHKLIENLGDDRALAMQGIAVFAEAFVRAIPTGKQNTFAAHNAPSFVGITLRRASPFNLANAFEKPVQSSRCEGLTEVSVERLGSHEQQIARLFGDARDRWAVLDLTGKWPAGLGEAQPNMTSLLEWLASNVQQSLTAEA